MASEAASDLPLRLPRDATEVATEGPWPFVTGVRYIGADGRPVHWQARANRKSDGPGSDGPGMSWTIGLLFAVGSACFVVGPIPAYAEAVGARADALTFFVGSLFFTVAGYLTYLQVARAAGHRWWTWAPRSPGWLAAVIQLAGTLYFNVSTFAAVLDLPEDLQDRAVWRPDAVGSLCFLVASAIAFAEAGHRWWSWRPGERDWHITALNMWGSVFFGLSAIGAHVDPSGTLDNTQFANGGTFLGALCFLAGSLLMMGEGHSRPSR